jgi:trk system potassium uptake protein TrkA
MKKNILVIGLGRFGLAVAKSLTQMNNNIFAVDISEEQVEKASAFTKLCAVCDASKMDVLEEIGAKNFQTAIVSVGNLESTFLTIANLSELGIENIIVRLENNEYENICRRLGATDIIIPEVAAARSLAHEVIGDSILDYYEITDEYGIVQIGISSKFESASLIDLDIRNKFDVNIVGIIRDKDFFIPKGIDLIEPNDVVLVVGKASKISKFEKTINSD